MIKRIDKRAKQLGYLIYLSDELYVKQLTRYSAVYIQRFNKTFMVYRLTFEKDNSRAVSERTIVKSTDILNAFILSEAYVKRYMSYLNDYKNK